MLDLHIADEVTLELPPPPPAAPSITERIIIKCEALLNYRLQNPRNKIQENGNFLLGLYEV
jgi:hypothetical protein